jgi:hypothetical protein
MEATIFTGWIYDHLLPHAEQVKVAHPLMLRAIAAAKKLTKKATDFAGLASSIVALRLPSIVCSAALRSNLSRGDRHENRRSPAT